jgi:uncharacterized protein YbjT (DUF2867 family)
MSKTVVVFGATGLVGREVTSQLLSNKAYEKVIVVVRRNFTPQNPKLVQIVIPDFTDMAQIKDKLQASEYYCCIGTTIKTAGSKEAFRRVDHDIPLQIAKLACELAIPYLVVISSIGAKTNTRNFYLRTKGEMEIAVKTAYDRNLKIVRPSLLMGNREEYRFAEKVSAIFMKTLGWIFLGPIKKYRGINATSVAIAMIKASDLPIDKLVLESDELQDLALVNDSRVI